MPYFRVETVEYVPKRGYYWAFEAKSKQEVIDKICSGTEIPTKLFTQYDNNRPATNVQILEIEDVTERANQIIKDNREYDDAKSK